MAATVFLGPNDTWLQSNNGTKIIGSTGVETVTLAAGVTGVTVDQTTEGVNLAALPGTTKFLQSGNTLKVYAADGTTLITTVTLQGDADGTLVTLPGSTTPVSALFNTTTGVMTIGGTTVSQTTPSPLPATLSISGATAAAEGTNATFTVTRVGDTSAAATVTFTIGAGTSGATIGTDTGLPTVAGTGITNGTLTATGGTITFAAGATTATITLPITADAATPETGEAVTVTLSGATGAALGTATVTTTITDVPAVTARLTTGLDTAVGSVIDGSRFLSAGVFVDTLNNSDSLTGTSGTGDRLYAELTGAVTTTPNSVSGIEIIDVTNVGVAAAELSLVNGDASVTTVKSANNTDALTVSNIGSAPTAFELSTTAEDFSATILASKLAGTADATTLTLNNVTDGDILLGPTAAGSGYETISIVSNGSVKNGNTNPLDLDDGNGNSLRTVNFSGSNALDIGVTPTTITRINAGTMTGKLDVALAANTNAVSVTGGTSDDIIDIGGYTVADSVNGGTGTDRLVLVNNEITAATATQTNVSSIEVIGLANAAAAGATYNLTNFGATGLRLDGTATAGALTVNYAAGTNSLDLQDSDLGGALTANVAGVATTDVMNMTLGTTAIGNDFGAQNVVFNGVETLNVLVQGTASTLGAVLTLTNTAATESVIITGSQSLTISGAVTADVINASGMTGAAALTMATATTNAVQITGTANGDTLFGSGAADLITSGAGNDSITAGAGDDTIDISGGGSNTVIFGNTFAANGKDTLVGFNTGAVASGGDVLNVVGLITVGALASVTMTGNQTVADNGLYVVNYGAAIATKDFGGTDFAELFAAAGVAFNTTTVANAEAVIVVQGTDVTHVYYADEGGNSALSADEVDLVGVLSGVTNANSFVLANFA